MRAKVLAGDCLESMRTMGDGSIDAIVSDPPYGMTSGKDTIEMIRSWVLGDEYVPTSKGFMGKTWDGAPPSPDHFREAARVLKPGGHILVFASPRTVHLMGLSLQLAGLEIRDCLQWLFSSGFPKSLSIAKAIDRRPGVVRHSEFAADLTRAREEAGLGAADVSERVVGSRSGACWNWEHHQCPEARHWPALKACLPALPDHWGAEIAEAERVSIGTRQQSALAVAPGQGTDRPERTIDLTLPATSGALRWQGWGTALKPANEPILLARKPIQGTIAANVLRHGTGGLNIDATRIPFANDADRTAMVEQVETIRAEGGKRGNSWKNSSDLSGANPANDRGRWPANVVMDPGAGAMLDRLVGDRPGMSGGGVHRSDAAPGMFGAIDSPHTARGDSGGPSRFFYSAKASRAERNAGLDAFPILTGGKATDRQDGAAGANNPRAGAGRTGGSRNPHPTVKPVSLMRWLCRLVCPPGGTILDPFTGSGTTGIAAVLEGFDFVGCELSPEYARVAEARIAHCIGNHDVYCDADDETFERELTRQLALF